MAGRITDPVEMRPMGEQLGKSRCPTALAVMTILCVGGCIFEMLPLSVFPGGTAQTWAGLQTLALALCFTGLHSGLPQTSDPGAKWACSLEPTSSLSARSICTGPWNSLPIGPELSSWACGNLLLGSLLRANT